MKYALIMLTCSQLTGCLVVISSGGVKLHQYAEQPQQHLFAPRSEPSISADIDLGIYRKPDRERF